MHRVEIDVEYGKAEGDWSSVTEARQWLSDLFQRVQTPDARLVAVEDSPVHWN